jgi:crossover junction endodeoxyribonuclease RusA
MTNSLDLSSLRENPDLVRLNLPWPDSRLLPNRKLHWAEKGRATQDSRWTAMILASNQKIIGVATGPDTFDYRPQLPMSACTAHVTFYPPDRRRRDLDNCLRSIKPYWDGMVDAGLLKDDSCIRQISVTMGEPDKHNPRVEIELSEV